MPTPIEYTAKVPYSSAQMFALVNNVAAYQDFLPYCHKSQMHVQTDQVIEASIMLEIEVKLPLLGRKKISQTFKTRNILTHTSRMDMQLIDGPMHHLSGFWFFEDCDSGGSIVRLNLAVEFSNKLWAIAFGAVSGQVANTLVNAFIARANQIYGKRESLHDDSRSGLRQAG